MKRHPQNWLYNPQVGNFLSWIIAYLIIMPYANSNIDNPIVLLIALFVGSFWTIWLHAYRQAEQIEIKHREQPHTKLFFIRSAVAIFIGIIAHLLAEGATKESVIKGVVGAFFLGAIFWLEFDFFLNYHRGKPILYIDQGKYSSKTDRFFKTKKAWWIISKIVLFLFATFLYYRILHLHLT